MKAQEEKEVLKKQVNEATDGDGPHSIPYLVLGDIFHQSMEGRRNEVRSVKIITTSWTKIYRG